MDRELSALHTEITYELYRNLLAFGGVSKHKLPRPLNIPRPGDDQPDSDAPPRRHASTPAEVIAVIHAAHRRL